MMARLLTVSDVRNCRWADSEQSAIDCEARFAEMGAEYLPFTARPDDIELHSRAIFRAASDGHYGEIQSYRPPAQVDVAAEARAARDMLLRETDWTQLGDVPDATRLAWSEYRQLLRDIPQQDGFPDSIQWPERPQT